MARIPIEMMVDRACGFDYNAPHDQAQADDTGTQLVCDACTALAEWAQAVDGDTPANAVAEKKLQALKAGRALVAAGW